MRAGSSAPGSSGETAAASRPGSPSKARWPTRCRLIACWTLPGGKVQHAISLHRVGHRALEGDPGLLAAAVSPDDPGALDPARICEGVLLHLVLRVVIGSLETLFPHQLFSVVAIAVLVFRSRFANLLKARSRQHAYAAFLGEGGQFRGTGQSSLRAGCFLEF